MDKLSDYSLGNDPVENFSKWFVEAKKVEQNAEAMTLASFDKKSNRPSARTLLYKGLSSHKNIIFYTNYESSKAHDFEENNEASLVFYWHVTKKQVRIQGRVKKMERSESEKYFHSRDRDSQLASYISHQSSPIEDKTALLSKLAEAQNKYTNTEIPLPDHWGGFYFEPYEFEFFLYGEHRLNDRFLYKKSGNTWDITRLQP
jgi:pyridoxamine 5'-phosphate oxidase